MNPQPLSLTHLMQPPTQTEANPAVGSARQTEGLRRASTARAAPPLLLLLHGVGSNERDLMGLAPYLDGRFLILSLRAPLTLGQSAFGWYPLQWTSEGVPIGDPERARHSRDAIAAFIPEAVQAYHADARRVFMMGFSQGAIMSLYLGLHQPELACALVPMSGRLNPEAWDERASDERLTGLPIFAVHGTRDSVLPIAEGRALRDRLSMLPVALTYTEYPMAHEVSGESLRDISAFLTAQLDKSTPNS